MTTIPNGPGSRPSTSALTRPADTTAYSVGDLIANSTVAGSVVPLSLSTAKAGVVSRVRLKVNDTAWKAGVIRCHFFKAQPTVGVGDNGALNAAETYAFTESEYLGYVDVTLAQQTSDGVVKGFAAFACIFDVLSGNTGIFALLEARTAVTPGSGKIFTVAIEAKGE
jgi:hypothetical protein